MLLIWRLLQKFQLSRPLWSQRLPLLGLLQFSVHGIHPWSTPSQASLSLAALALPWRRERKPDKCYHTCMSEILLGNHPEGCYLGLW